jgi:hypothetical protein
MKESLERTLEYNVKFFWTCFAIALSIIVVIEGLKYNFFYANDIGFKMLKISCQYNSIRECTTLTITSEPSATNVYFHAWTGCFGFLVIQVLHIPVWIFRNKLVGRSGTKGSRSRKGKRHGR